jgi:hypothetical protein
MAIVVTHTKVSTIPDGDDTSLIRPSDWNSTHTLTGLGTMAEQNANAVAITGGTMTGVSITGYIPTTEKAQPLGVATLDAGGQVPVSQLPPMGDLNYQGTWNASTNTPTLTSSVGTKGYYYVVSVAGSTNLNGITDWQIGDWAVYNGSVWQKIDNTDAVTSVNGQTGTVTITLSGLGAGTIATQNANAVAITGGAIDGTTVGASNPAAVTGTTITAATGFVSENYLGLPGLGGNLKTNSGTSLLNWDGGGSGNVTVNGGLNANPSNKNVSIAPTGTGTATINPATAGTMNNMVIGGTTPLAITGTTITGTSFVGSGASLTNVVNSLTASTGISVSASTGAVTVTNTAPDQTVAISSGTGISVTGTYPNFTVTNTSPSSGGDVVGPASATDNAIARYDSTTGKLIQNSLVIIDDTGSVTGVNALTAQSLTVNNNATLGSSNTDSLDVRARISSDLDPETNNAKDIGTNGRNWRDGFFGRTVHTVNLELTGTTSFDGSQGTAGQVLTSAGTGNTPTWTTPTTGTVTSVAATVPSFLSVSGSPITSTGTLAISYSGTALPVVNGGTGVTTSTGSGANVLGTSPTITTPTIDKINTSVANTSLGAGNASIMKNRIINGAMVIDQRNAGASVSVTTAFIFGTDRWRCEPSVSGKLTMQQNAGSVTPPVGFTNYLGLTSTSAYSVSSGDYFWLEQFIEGYNLADLGFGTANAKTVTLSFWVYSSLTGQFGASITNGSTARCYPFNYTISTANTWTPISVTIAGDTTGTWATDNSTGMRLNLSLGTGSSRLGSSSAWGSADYRGGLTGATSVVGTSGATFYITGVQLEVGTSDTGFEYVNYQTSLANCQRYYQKTYSPSVAPATNTDLGTKSSIAYTTSNTAGGFYLQTPMRTVPTFTLYSGTGTSGVWSASGGGNTAAMGIYGQNENGFLVTTSSGLTVGQIYYGHWTASAEL